MQLDRPSHDNTAEYRNTPSLASTIVFARNVGWLWLLALTAAVVLGAAKCPGKANPSNPASRSSAAPHDSADQVMFGVRGMLTHQGVARGVVLADTAYVYDDGTRLDLRRVNVTFVNALGLTDGVLTAREGTYNSRLSRLEARGQVLIVGTGGRRLRTEQLVFDPARNQLSGNGAFVYDETNAPRKLSGNGFESNPQLTNVRLRKVVGAGVPAHPAPTFSSPTTSAR